MGKLSVNYVIISPFTKMIPLKICSTSTAIKSDSQATLERPVVSFTTNHLQYKQLFKALATFTIDTKYATTEFFLKSSNRETLDLASVSLSSFFYLE